MNKYSHGFFIECIYLHAPFCSANAHTNTEQKQNKTKQNRYLGTRNNCTPLKLGPQDKKED